MFYYEEKTFDGRWTPVKSKERPTDKRCTGEQGPKYRMVHEIPADKHGWSLKDLQIFFNAVSNYL